MKKTSRAIKTTSYVAGIFAIASALVVTVLLIMSSVGILSPRRVKLTVHTDTVSKIYDATPLSGGSPEIKYGILHPGHKFVTLSSSEHTDVGNYKNEATYMIVDASGADVTDMYEIRKDFGEIIIDSRPLIVASPDQSKRYNGSPLVSKEIYVSGGTLAQGHSLVCHSTTSITEPGEQEILPTYSILDQNGADVTDQYQITNNLGTLTVLPIAITVQTDSATKTYDGKPLSASKWQLIDGTLLDNHTLSVKCYTEETNVGFYPNQADVMIYDESGKDVSQFYQITVHFGTLTISAIPLHIVTGSMTKQYDGTPLSCETWSIASGKLGEGERITMLSCPVLNTVGNKDNLMRFVITDANGNDITNQYEILQDCGQLSLTPRAITIRSGSASKVYDGTALRCEEFKIVKGTLCTGETIELSFTSFSSIGYTQNYVTHCSIQKKNDDGSIIDVTENYSITYDYGTLTVTAK